MKRTILSVCVFAMTAFSGAAHAGRLYMFSPGLHGDASQVEGGIVLDSFQFSTSVPISERRQPGRPHLSEVTITKPLDASSADLAFYAVTGRAMNVVSIELYKPNTSPPVLDAVIELRNVYVTHHMMTGAGGPSSDLPSESITLNYGSILWTYYKDGEPMPPFSWNRARNTP
ncbi:MAG: type VI secretion system tube protein Hcp [Myxococcota bacterium]